MPRELPGELQRLADRYAAFAVDEARGNSALYEKLALAVTNSPEILAFIAGLPVSRRQPNLFLAAVRHVCGIPEDADRLLMAVRQEPDRIRAVMLSHTTQTNEPGRCAVLLPLLALLPPPAGSHRGRRVSRPLPAAGPLRLRLWDETRRAGGSGRSGFPVPGERVYAVAEGGPAGRVADGPRPRSARSPLRR
jgi:Uncharacterized protein conserved in bacteria (DUF2332)